MLINNNKRKTNLYKKLKTLSSWLNIKNRENHTFYKK
jgi:hypothetical protein